MSSSLGRTASGRALLLLAAALAAAALLAVGPALARASDDAVQSIGAVPVVPAGAVSLGATPSSEPLKLDIVLSPRNPAGLQAEALAVSTPGSPEHGQYLSVAQVAARYGQGAAAVHSADAALRSMGLVPGAVTANHLTIPVSTTVGQAARSLGSSFASYRLSSGRTFLANTSAPRLPSSLAAITSAVIGLDTLPYSDAAPPKGQGTSASTAAPAVASGPQPCAAATNAGEEQDGYTFNQLADAYEVNDLYAAKHEGAGVKVGLFEIDPYSTSDLKAFQSCYKTKVSVKLVNVDGGSGGGPGEGEAALDVDTVVAMAPKSAVTVYDSNDNDAYSTDVIDGFTAMFDADKIDVVSASYGLCEAYVQNNFPGLIASENTLFEQAATEGISAFTASGDTGSEGCARNGDGSEGLVTSDLGSQPFVTSVGGTTLDSVGPAPSETVWNESARGAGAGGGGISKVWAMPSWQSGPGVDNSYTSGTPCGAGSGDCREVPDVSADADPYGGYIVDYDGGWTDIGGTSASSPLWAGMVADILSESTAHRGGFLDPTLYAGAATESGLFNDITVGNNDYGDRHSGAYPASSKYDMASGLGTPIAPGLATLIEGAATKIGFTDAPGTGAPPAYLGPDAVTAAPAACTVGDAESSLSTPHGTVKLSPSLTCEQIGNGWNPWSNGYTGYVYSDAGYSVTLTLPAKTKAFYLYAEPESYNDYEVQATSGSTTSGALEVNGESGAQYLGFYGQTPTTYVSKITVTSSDTFAIGEFGIAP